MEKLGLGEYFIEYFMLSVKAKFDWVPYGTNLKLKKMVRDIDYNLIEYKVPYLTDMIGYYRTFEYQFTEESLLNLSAILDVAYSKIDKSLIHIQKQQHQRFLGKC